MAIEHPPFANSLIYETTSSKLLPVLPTGSDDDEADDDPTTYLRLLGLDSNSSFSDTFSELYTRIYGKRTVSEQEIVMFVLSSSGLALNCLLLCLMFCAQSRLAWRIRNQRFFITISSVAYILLCVVPVIEFILLQTSIAKFILSCLSLVQQRTMKHLCRLVILGSAVGCAVDNYLAVCKPFFHYAHSSRISIVLTVSLVLYCVGAAFLTFSDFIFPLNLQINCTDPPDLYFRLHGLSFAFIHLSSSADDMDSYCQTVNLCVKSSTLEVSVLVVWLVVIVPISYFYITTAITLRTSLNTLFSDVPRRSSLTIPSTDTRRSLGSSGKIQRRATGNSSFLIPSIVSIDRLRRRSSPNALDSIDSSEKCEKPKVRKLRSAVYLTKSAEENSLRPKSSIGLSSIQEQHGDELNDNQADASIQENDNGHRVEFIVDIEDNDGDPCGNGNVPSTKALEDKSQENQPRLKLIETAPERETNEPKAELRTTKSRRLSITSFTSRFSASRQVDRRVSVSQIQTLNLLRNRRRSSNTLIIILLIFLLTWAPEILLETANELFFTENFRTEHLPKLFYLTKYFDHFIMLNAVIDPLLYGASELQRNLCKPCKRSVTA